MKLIARVTPTAGAYRMWAVGAADVPAGIDDTIEHTYIVPMMAGDVEAIMLYQHAGDFPTKY